MVRCGTCKLGSSGLLVIAPLRQTLPGSLLHNLRKRKMGGPITNWIQSFVGLRSTTLRLLDYAEDYDINTGIP